MKRRNRSAHSASNVLLSHLRRIAVASGFVLSLSSDAFHRTLLSIISYQTSGTLNTKEMVVSSQPSQPALLHLSQGPAATQKSDHSHDTSCWERLEQVPACVVHEEDALHRQYRAVEQPVRKRCIAQSLAQMADVRAQCSPHAEENWQRSDNGCRKDDCDDLGRGLRVGAEDVVDLGLGGVSKGRLGDRERYIGVAGDLEVKDLALVWCGRPKGSNHNRRDDWL
jgi:hypothetical protein